MLMLSASLLLTGCGGSVQDESKDEQDSPVETAEEMVLYPTNQMKKSRKKTGSLMKIRTSTNPRMQRTNRSVPAIMTSRIST